MQLLGSFLAHAHLAGNLLCPSLHIAYTGQPVQNPDLPSQPHMLTCVHREQARGLYDESGAMQTGFAARHDPYEVRKQQMNIGLAGCNGVLSRVLSNHVNMQ